MRLYILLITFALLVSMNKSQTVGCGLTGAFCGRGPNRVDCCSGYHCDIAPNDAYANCISNSCGGTGAFCGRGPNRVNCCPGYQCNIAPNDAYAYCVINSG